MSKHSKKGRIYKGVGGFYYIKPENEDTILEVKARGKLRNNDLGILVGDYVRYSSNGTIEEVVERKNSLLRPSIANVDQILIVTSAVNPRTSSMYLDKLIAHAESLCLEIVICLNKCDLDDSLDLSEYILAGYEVIKLSAFDGIGIKTLTDRFIGKTTVLAGDSGVGKSTLLNTLKENFGVKTGEVSDKLGRGRHTTRHSELFEISGEKAGSPNIGLDDKNSIRNIGIIVDSPGFGDLDMEEMDILPEEVKELFVEFENAASKCKYKSCYHINEPDCGVKNAVELGMIGKTRYKNYKLIFEEVKKASEKF